MINLRYLCLLAGWVRLPCVYIVIWCITLFYTCWSPRMTHIQKLQIHRPPWGLERKRLHHCFSKVVSNLPPEREGPPPANEQVCFLGSFQPYCPAHISALLFPHPSTQPLSKHPVPNKRDRLRGVKRPSERGAPHSGTACSSQRRLPAICLLVLGGCYHVCKQPLPRFSGISLIMTIPFLPLQLCTWSSFSLSHFPQHVCLSLW